MAPVSTALVLLAVARPVGAYTCASGYTDKTGTPKCAGVLASSCTTSTCCQVQETCSDFAVLWAISQLAGGGCAEDTKFFDTKKTNTTVASPAGETEVKAACCTAFSEAKCSDWFAVKGTCDNGQSFVGTTSAPADSDDGKDLSVAKYKEMCCVPAPATCSDHSVAWVLAAGFGGGCVEDGATKFFDLKKNAATVADPEADADIKTACCTPFADATCSDWRLDKGACTSGSFVETNSAPADSDDGKDLSVTKYQEMCCEVAGTTCSDHSVAWVLSAGFGGGCAEDAATKFFDLKKNAATVAAPSADADIKTACCTPFADAKCSDWRLDKGACTSGSFVETNSAPADSADGKDLSVAKYQEMCCASTCSDHSVAWALTQLAGGGCAEDTKFFDLKKTADAVVAPAGEAEIKAACCTAFADATCSDWSAVKPACDAGHVVDVLSSAPPDNDAGTDLSSAKYKEICCVDPVTCASVDNEVDSAFQAAVPMVTILGLVVAWIVG